MSAVIQDLSNTESYIQLVHTRCADPDCVDCAADYLTGLIGAMCDKQDHEPFANFILALERLVKKFSNEDLKRETFN